ncbi:MAG: formylglycine-generating enzyme family protein [Deltaproteobacteria bacterium]|nr:formylglycine-generating enzyme family protein [Deltaproteobacteria bacterium]
MELDISCRGEEKDVFPSEETISVSFPEPTDILPSTKMAADLLSDLPRTPENRLCEASFVYVAPRSFIMGSPDHEPGRGSDETQHEVTLTRGYSIQATPVTQGQWKEVMGSNSSCFLIGGEDCPVEGVTWNESQEFIKRLNQNKEYVYRLPTEAEWEYACRAGVFTPFFNGEITEHFCRIDPCLDNIGWYCGNSDRKTHPVAKKNPNAWGLFDMSGNVCEWCQDWYGEYAALPKIDPMGPAFGPGRVVRGGSWFSNSQNCRSASRFYRAANSRSDFVGFRLAREL